MSQNLQEIAETVLPKAFSKFTAENVKDVTLNSEEFQKLSRQLHETKKADRNDFAAVVIGASSDLVSKTVVKVAIVQTFKESDTDVLIGVNEIGMQYDDQFLKGLEHIESIKDIMFEVALAYAVNDLAMKVGHIYVLPSVSVNCRKFLENTVQATSSWFNAATGFEDFKLTFHHTDGDFLVATTKELNRLQELNDSLNYERCVLGASSGKESTLNKYLLADSGYEIHEVTFKNAEDFNGADMELVFKVGQEASKIWVPTLHIAEGKAFDPQGIISIPRYAMLIVEALKKQAGILAVGTEFGCSKIWYEHSPENNVKGKKIHDLSVDEGAYICQQIESLFNYYNLEVHIVAPTSVLHEVGILRALVDVKGFNLADLKSCWRANILNHNYCGICYKCQRLARYFNHLEGLYPGHFGKFIDFEEIGLASGTMLSYSMQYHLFEDYPEMPWDTAICIDSENMRLLDYRTGNKILRTLVTAYGFKDSIFADVFPNVNELRLLDSVEVVKSLENYLGVEFVKLIKAAPRKLHKCPLEFPGEMEFLNNVLGTEEILSEIGISGKDYDFALLMERYHNIPVFDDSNTDGLGSRWRWLRLYPQSEENKDNAEITLTLKLPQKSLDNPVVRRWMREETITNGLNHFKIPYQVI